jgi:hypothetical protein
MEEESAREKVHQPVNSGRGFGWLRSGASTLIEKDLLASFDNFFNAFFRVFRPPGKASRSLLSTFELHPRSAFAFQFCRASSSFPRPARRGWHSISSAKPSSCRNRIAMEDAGTPRASLAAVPGPRVAFAPRPSGRLPFFPGG